MARIGAALLPALVGLAAAGSPAQAQAVCGAASTTTSSYCVWTGSGTFTVPAGVTSIDIEAGGAPGGASVEGGPGGSGAAVEDRTFAVTPGDVLSVAVGAGGGSAGASAGWYHASYSRDTLYPSADTSSSGTTVWGAGAGGGYSGLLDASGTPLLVAAGGGGGGGYGGTGGDADAGSGAGAGAGGARGGAGAPDGAGGTPAARPADYDNTYTSQGTITNHYSCTYSGMSPAGAGAPSASLAGGAGGAGGGSTTAGSCSGSYSGTVSGDYLYGGSWGDPTGEGGAGGGGGYQGGAGGAGDWTGPCECGGGGGSSYSVSPTSSKRASTAAPRVTIYFAAPAFSSAPTASYGAGTPGSFTVAADSSTPVVFTRSGPLPLGLSFVDNEDGTATIAGTPAPGTGGTFPLTITATPDHGPAGTQELMLTVQSGRLSSPRALNFGSQTTGQPGPELWLVVQNAGPYDMRFDGPATITGTDETAFAIPAGDDLCEGRVLEVHDLCYVGVQYTPGVARAELATLTFGTNDAMPVPATIALTGTGVTADAGPQGATGAQGPAGVQGPSGSTGAQGATGAQGVPGSTGSQGLTGAQGASGSDGTNGTNGINGTDGAAGPQGATGPRGLAGINGTRGEAGAKGDTGAPGATGPRGPMAYAVVTRCRRLTSTKVTCTVVFRGRASQVRLVKKAGKESVRIGGTTYVVAKRQRVNSRTRLTLLPVRRD